MRRIAVAFACFGTYLIDARRMQSLEQHSSQSGHSSAKALASVLVSPHGANFGSLRSRRHASVPLERNTQGISWLSHIRGGARKVDDLDTLDEEDLLNFDVGTGTKAPAAAASGKMQMPSPEEIQKIMSDPQYQEQLQKLMSDPEFREEMRRAADEMTKNLSPEDLKLLEELKNSPDFQEQAKQIAEQLASNPELVKQAEEQFQDQMKEAVAQTMNDPEAMKRIQEMLADPELKEKTKAALAEMVQLLPPEVGKELQKLLDDPDFEEKMRNAASEMKDAGTLDSFLKNYK